MDDWTAVEWLVTIGIIALVCIVIWVRRDKLPKLGKGKPSSKPKLKRK